MIIRSKNRLCYYDRHISDAVLRLLCVLLTFLIGLTAWMLVLRTDRFIDAVLWVRLQDEMVDLLGQQVDKLGTSEETLFTRAHKELDKDGALLTALPDYLERLSPNNNAVLTVRLRLKEMRIILKSIGLGFLAAFLAAFLFLRVIYGANDWRWRIFQWLYAIFNRDATGRQPYGYVHSFTPFQRKVFEMAFALSKGNPDGHFELDLKKCCEWLWPGDGEVTERRRAMTGIAFHDLCEEYFYFQIAVRQSFILKTYSPILPYEDQVKREMVRDHTGREVEIYGAGRFRFSPPLYRELLRRRYSRLPHPVVYAVDDRKHPFAFRMYLLLWEQWCEARETAPDGIQTAAVSVALDRLMDRACFDVSTEHDANLLEKVHLDLGQLKEMGFLRGWYVQEHGEKVNPLWYKGVELFTYDPVANVYRLNSAVLLNKNYTFEMIPFAELDKIRIVRRRCAFIDNLNTPCNRAAVPGTPYCKRHAKALDFETPRLFYEKVKCLMAPGDSGDAPEPDRPPDGGSADGGAGQGLPSFPPRPAGSGTGTRSPSDESPAEIVGAPGKTDPASGSPSGGAPPGGDPPETGSPKKPAP